MLLSWRTLFGRFHNFGYGSHGKHMSQPQNCLCLVSCRLTSNPSHSLSRCPTPHYNSGRHKGPFNYLAELRSCGSACATFWMSFVITLIHRPILAPLSISRLENQIWFPASCISTQKRIWKMDRGTTILAKHLDAWNSFALPKQVALV